MDIADLQKRVSRKCPHCGLETRKVVIMADRDKYPIGFGIEWRNGGLFGHTVTGVESVYGKGMWLGNFHQRGVGGQSVAPSYGTCEEVIRSNQIRESLEGRK